jgi:transformation/transcription domain-associated protein
MVYEIFNIGLTSFMAQQQRLPKDLLQAGLKPILVNLSDHKKLTVPGLEGLARLLKLLTNYFKVEIGRKLLSHLRSWADSMVLKELSSKPLAGSENILIIAAILDVFHLLPPAANVFLAELVQQVLELEAMVVRSKSSPFRLPLLRFLNRYAVEAVDYFLENYQNAGFAILFCSLIQLEEAEELRTALFSKTESLLSRFLIMGQTISQEQVFFIRNGIFLFSAMSELRNDWLLENSQIVKGLLNFWKSDYIVFLDQYQRHRVKIKILGMMIMHLEKHKEYDLDVFFNLTYAFLDQDLMDLNSVKKYLFNLVSTATGELRKSILVHFLRIYAREDVMLTFKTAALRFLVIPLLMTVVQTDVMQIYDTNIVVDVLNLMWISQLNDGSNSEKDALKLELIQFTTLLIYQVPDLLSDCLKDLIKFAWGHLKMEDVSVKQAAYVLLCRFIKEYETPGKIVTQTYVAQLRAHSTELRPMVRQALDSIIPVLPNRAGMGVSETGGMPVWIQWIRKTIIEDGHSVSQLVSVYQLIIRNPDEFYPCCEHFLPQIVSSLARLGLSSNATGETKTLSIDLAKLLLKWELKARVKNEEEMSVDDPQNTVVRSDNLKEIILAFLVRFCLSLTDPTLSKAIFSVAFDTLKDFMKIWPRVAIAMLQLNKVVAMEITEANLGFVRNASQILSALCEIKPKEWVIDNVQTLIHCVDRWSSYPNAQLNVALGCVLESLCNALDESQSDENHAIPSIRALFSKTVDARLHDRIKSSTNIAALDTILKVFYLPRLKIHSVNQSLRAHLTELVPFVQNLVTEYSGLIYQGEPTSGLSLQPEYIQNFIDILNAQILYLGDLRKQFLALITQIIDTRQFSQLHRHVLLLLRKWILSGSIEAFPTIKEKSNIAVKMSSFEQYENNEVFEEYMELVADIYEEESLLQTELTVRLENVFLMGTKMSNSTLRNRFLHILDRSIQDTVQSRMMYILGVQNWQSLQNTFWITQALDILLGAVSNDRCVYNCNTSKKIAVIEGVDCPEGNENEFLSDFVKKEEEFLTWLVGVKMESMISSLRGMIYSSVDLSFTIWTRTFAIAWNCFNDIERHDYTKFLISLLAKEYNTAQLAIRPNVIQALLEGTSLASPSIQLPPQLVKYLGKNYNTWYMAIGLLENWIAEDVFPIGNSNKDEEKIRDSFMDALSDLYAELNESDYFAGIWRRRCLFGETNAAVSFEQCGLWSTAQKYYENAQAKARTCVLPFTESEYVLWEKQWIQCTEKLQQWDILCDLSKHESQPELLLECAWRLSDWNADKDSLNMTLQSIAQPATPRKKLFQAFLVLNKMSDNRQEIVSEFQQICDEGIQLVLKKWHSLPKIVSNSHVDVFHSFQQYVELSEAFQIQNNLLGTSAANIDTKSLELKNILSTWRDRLPNTWDDMNLWSDLVAWRQHVFTAINKAYLPLIPHINSTGSTPTSSYAYRGYHETAWIINRFAHVARKHKLPEVCISSLGKIYTLPNIEIQEAFYKLREQALCHKDVLGEYSAALDVINNTNLLYFNSSQKAEFFNLRGTFLAKLNLFEDAHQAFSSAIQVEPSLSHSWLGFGEFNDSMFERNPDEMKYAVEALNCYFHASSLLNNGRSRKVLSRILWILSLDDDSGQLLQVCENQKTELPIWYWITFIPELIGSLAGKEASFARAVLIKIAKSYPQALHFQIRTAKEDFASMKKKFSNGSQQNSQSNEGSGGKDELSGKESASNEMDVQQDTTSARNDKNEIGSMSPATPWESIEEIMSILKTAYPLLALTMETMVDQILARLKPTTDEDIYRLIVALLNDGVQVKPF